MNSWPSEVILTKSFSIFDILNLPIRSPSLHIAPFITASGFLDVYIMPFKSIALLTLARLGGAGDRVAVGAGVGVGAVAGTGVGTRTGAEAGGKAGTGESTGGLSSSFTAAESAIGGEDTGSKSFFIKLCLKK